MAEHKPGMPDLFTPFSMSLFFRHFSETVEKLTLELHAFKNRQQTVYTDAEVCELIEKERAFWCHAKGNAKRNPKLDKKYPGYTGYTMTVEPSLRTIVPSRATWGVQIDGKVFLSANKKYETALTGLPARNHGGFVLISTAPYSATTLKSIQTKLSKLPSSIHQQLQSTTAHVILYLKRVAVDIKVCQDDVTGEIYPYTLDRVHVLVKQ